MQESKKTTASTPSGTSRCVVWGPSARAEAALRDASVGRRAPGATSRSVKSGRGGRGPRGPPPGGALGPAREPPESHGERGVHPDEVPGGAPGSSGAPLARGGERVEADLRREEGPARPRPRDRRPCEAGE